MPQSQATRGAAVATSLDSDMVQDVMV